jgi:sigma-E factor negative regulatory protein RseA
MEKISTWMDGELSRDECAKLARQCNKDQREAWDTYHLIGEALRGELDEKSCTVGTQGALSQKIFAALEREPNVLVPAVARAAAQPLLAHAAAQDAASLGRYVKVGNGASVWKPWLMAASVATAAVVGWQAVTGDWRRDNAANATAAATPTKVAPAPIPMQPVSAAVSYDNYIRAHAEVAPATRLSGARVYGQPVNYGPTH